MEEHIQVDPANHARRRISYLDLLGFTELIRTKNWKYIFSYYKDAIEYCARERGFGPVEKTWFSDTFLLYSPDDSPLSFSAIETTTRFFVYFLVSHGIPVRGAMSCDDFYADKRNNVFFGKALIEAYHYGENQNWIGFVLSPSCVEQMAAIGLPADQRLDYAYWNIPYKRMDETLPRSLPAYILGGSAEGSSRNVILDKLREMRARLKCSDHIAKYENAISFIEANGRKIEKG
jgi:hypothetical protein